MDPNISNAPELRKLVRAAASSRGERPSGWRSLLPRPPKPVVLVLPDLCVRASIIRLENLPARPEEQADLIRWRLSQDHLFPVVGTKVTFEKIRGNGAHDDATVTVLAVAIRETVLHEYERVCEAAGLCPIDVDSATFRLFNMWARATQWFKRKETEDLIWVSVFDEALTVLIFQGHRLGFVRTKLLRGRFWSPPGLAGPEFNRLVEEILASVASCAQTCPGLAPQRMVVATEEWDAAFAQAIGEAAELQAEAVDWDHACGAGWKPLPADPHMAVIPAVAGLVGTG